MNNTLVLGADIGGSHITTAIIDLRSKEVLTDSLIRRRVNSHGTANEIIADWAEAILETMSRAAGQIVRIGIAMPGPFDYEEGISGVKGLDKFDALYGMNVKDLLAAQLGLERSDILMMNDAACFLQGEVFSGAAKGAARAVGLTLGTGLGTARYHGLKVEDANLWCMPFHNGFAEEYISTRWFVKRFREMTGEEVKDVKALSERYHLQPEVAQIFDEFGANLSLFLKEFYNLDEPEVIVIGGNIMNAHELFRQSLDKHLADYQIHVPIKRSILQENAALIGAASLWQTQVVGSAYH